MESKDRRKETARERTRELLKQTAQRQGPDKPRKKQPGRGSSTHRPRVKVEKQRRNAFQGRKKGGRNERQWGEVA